MGLQEKLTIMTIAWLNTSHDRHTTRKIVKFKARLIFRLYSMIHNIDKILICISLTTF